MRHLVSLFGMLAVLCLPMSAVKADSANEIQVNVQTTLTKFKTLVAGGEKLLDTAEAALVFPDIIEGAFVFGAEYGEGGLVEDEDIKSYYSFFSASFGLQAGAQSKSVILLFMTDDALQKLMKRRGFEIGADIEVAVVNRGASGKISSTTFNKPVVAIVFEQKGLLAGVSLNGAKITKIKR